MSFWHLSIDALIERRTRTALTILMVVLGASLLIAINGMSAGMVSFMQGQFDQLGSNLLMVASKSEEFELDDDVVDEIALIPGVKAVIPYYQQGVQFKSGSRTINAYLIGMDQKYLPIMFPTISLKEGSFISPADSIGILLGNDLLEMDNPEGQFAFLGDSIKASYMTTVNGKPSSETKSFSVRGLLNYLGSNFVPVDQMGFVTLNTAKSFLDRNKYDGLYIYTEDSQYNSAVTKYIKNNYDASVINPEQIAEMINTIMGMMMGFINGIAVISLIVAGIGIIATQYTSMMERIKEIGMMKALGYREREILVLFLNEAIIIGVIGGIVGVIAGILLGMGLSAAISELASGGDSSGMSGYGRGGLSGGSSSSMTRFDLIPVFEPQTLLFTIVLCLILAILAGLYPAMRAAKMDPVEALRKE